MIEARNFQVSEIAFGNVTHILKDSECTTAVLPCRFQQNVGNDYCNLHEKLSYGRDAQ